MRGSTAARSATATASTPRACGRTRSAWDFNGHQGGYQADAKFVHDDATGKLTIYGVYSDKTEPNEDATVVTTATQGKVPYTRPFIYPNFAAEEKVSRLGRLHAAGANYQNYYSDAQRTDYLAYAKYDWNVSDKVHWSNQAYYHHDDGVGVVAGPITVAGLPGLFAKYYPTLSASQLSTLFGGSGLAARTTEYRIDREGVVSTLHVDLGNHQIELGGWYEHQSSSAYRRWYAVDAADPSTPYQRPADYEDPLITQYGSQVRVDEYQTHIQDSWHVLPTVTILGGFKSTFQDASQRVPVQPIPGSFTGSTALPVGKLNTSTPFLPQLGALVGRDAARADLRQRAEEYPPVPDQRGLGPVALRAGQPAGVRPVQAGREARDELDLRDRRAHAAFARSRADHRLRGPGQLLSCRFQQPPAGDQPDGRHHVDPSAARRFCRMSAA